MGTDADLIAVMRPERTGAADITRTTLIEMVSELPGARRLGDGLFAFDTGIGGNLTIHVGPASIEFRHVDTGDDPPREAVPDDVDDGGYDAGDRSSIVSDLVEDLALPLQTRTRWALEFSAGGEYLAVDPCPQCATLHFEWEDVCVRCGARLAGTTNEQLDADDVDAQLVLARLLQLGWIEIAAGMARHRVENAVAAALANFSTDPEHLHRVLVDNPNVDELYCSPEDLARIATAIRNRARE